MILHGESFNQPGGGLIYVHIPKVAGSSIEKSLGMEDVVASNYHSYTGWDYGYRIWMQHATLLQIQQFWGPIVNTYFSFTFVRNPWDRAVSDWLWFKNDVSSNDDMRSFADTTLKDYLLKRNGYENVMDFNAPNRQKNTYRADHGLCQYHFMCNDQGEILPMNFIGRFENITDDWSRLMNTLSNIYDMDFNLELPHDNKTNKRDHYSTYYDQETQELAAERYAIDIKLFDYEFEDVKS